MARNSDIRFVFFGSPDIAVAVLDELETSGLVPALVVTQPDKPAGRGRELTPSAVSVWADERGIDCLKPAKIDEAFVGELANSEWDVFVVVAYGHILPHALIDIPKRGVLNVHPSLLPKFRGPSPIKSAILAGERVTGVSIMQIDEQMDHGPVIAQGRVEIEPEDWPIRASILEGILSHEGGVMLAEILPQWVAGELTATSQDDSAATYCTKLTKTDGLVDLTTDAPEAILTKIRALEGWPGAYTFFERNGTSIRVLLIDAHIEDGALVLDTVKPEGKQEMPYTDFSRSGATPARVK